MSDTAQSANGASDDVPASEARDDEPDALAERLRAIADQPLETRAESLAQLHDELRAMLEAGDAPPHA
jgi:hypothetical protein